MPGGPAPCPNTNTHQPYQHHTQHVRCQPHLAVASCAQHTKKKVHTSTAAAIEPTQQHSTTGNHSTARLWVVMGSSWTNRRRRRRVHHARRRRHHLDRRLAGHPLVAG